MSSNPNEPTTPRSTQPVLDDGMTRFAPPEINIPYGSSASQVPPSAPPAQPIFVVKKSPISGCATLAIGGAGCLILLGVIALVLTLSGVLSISGIASSISGAISGLGQAVNQPARVTINSSQTLLQGIMPLGQLVSVSTQLAKADVNVNVWQGTLNACGYSANHVVQGGVEAGLDLSRIDINDVAYNAVTNTYTVTLPYPQLTSCRVDYIRQYDRSFTTCNVDWDEARLLANYSTINDFRDESIEGGILDRAASEARLVVSNFISIVTGASVEIVFDPPEPGTMVASCSPSLPDGWQIDANGTWSSIN
ncbi:MAG: DUF4230 domain-containing protein [Pleurocapsa minor GSE-CHR-MK-17-07R]|nr:DUF4230 domain-containing protein [Pleurocapsa minor GSE-CHR-MK 17-07R]